MYTVNESINEEVSFKHILKVYDIVVEVGMRAKMMELTHLDRKFTAEKNAVTTPSPHPTLARRASRESKG